MAVQRYALVNAVYSNYIPRCGGLVGREPVTRRTSVPNAQCEGLHPQPSAHHSIDMLESNPSCHVMSGHNATGLITNHWRGRVIELY